jgi:sugar phosphate isomerase/epimerase
MWTSYFIEYTPEKAVEALATGGWKYTEISDEHSRTLLERGDPVKIGKAFRQFAADLGFSFPQGHLFLGVDIVQRDPAVRDRMIDELRRWLDLFLALDIEAAVLHPGGGGPEWNRDAEKEKIDAVRRESLERLLAHIAGSSMSICLENCFPPAGLIDDLLTIMEPFERDNLGICLDTGHLNLNGGGFADFIRRAGADLKALHIADNLGQNDNHMLPYGKGCVPWAEVMGALKEIDYKGLFNLEVGGERDCPLPIKLAKLEYARQLADLMCG